MDAAEGGFDPSNGYVTIASVDEVLEKKWEEQKSLEMVLHVSALFYQGKSALELRGFNGASTQLHVMEFHCLFLPPTLCFENEHDRVADDDAVELFGINYSSIRGTILPSIHEDLDVQSWKQIRLDAAAMDRWQYTYTIWLHFFGWRLHNEETGELDRHRNWRGRYRSLSRAGLASEDPFAGGGSTRCYTELTRMLRVLLEMKLANYAVRCLIFLCDEFHAGRLHLLMTSWDRYYFPLVAGCTDADPDMVAFAMKKFQRVGSSDSD
jgi:hypothetical protein